MENFLPLCKEKISRVLASSKAGYSLPACDHLHSPQEQTLARHSSEHFPSWAQDASSLLQGVLSCQLGSLLAEPILSGTFAPLHCKDSILAPLKWLNALPSFCKETGLSKPTSLEGRLLSSCIRGDYKKYTYWLWLHTTTIFLLRKGILWLSKNMEMLLFGALLTDFFFVCSPRCEITLGKKHLDTQMCHLVPWVFTSKPEPLMTQHAAGTKICWLGAELGS